MRFDFLGAAGAGAGVGRIAGGNCWTGEAAGTELGRMGSWGGEIAGMRELGCI